MNTKIENDYIKLEISNGILIGTYKVKFITLEIAKSVVELRRKFTKNKDYQVLIKDSITVKIEKEARDYLSSNEGTAGIFCAAVLVDSIYKITLMNFYMKVLPPKMPVKLFSTEEKALLWLNEYKKLMHEQ